MFTLLLKRIIYFVILYYAIGYGIYLLSPWLIFSPPEPMYQDDTIIIKIPSRNGAQISAIYLPNKPSNLTLLYSHGNSEDLGTIFPNLMQYNHKGFSVLAYDYQGYGTSSGSFSEANSYADIRAAFRYLTQEKKIPVNNIVLLGRSLGSGPTIDLAQNYAVKAVILESPFFSAFRTITYIPIIPFDRFKNYEKVKNLQSPILVLHGTEDQVISDWHSKKLFELMNMPKHYKNIAGANHNNILQVMQDEYWQELEAFFINYTK